jgi:hypothetical protein
VKQFPLVVEPCGGAVRHCYELILLAVKAIPVTGHGGP